MVSGSVAAWATPGRRTDAARIGTASMGNMRG
jgi:hypothetical protein